WSVTCSLSAGTTAARCGQRHPCWCAASAERTRASGHSAMKKRRVSERDSGAICDHRHMSSLSVLAAHRAFMRFWWGRLAGTMAAQMLMVALGWAMYDLTASAWDLGLVGLMQFMPALALTLVAGHVVDRHDRRRVFAG